MHLCNLFYIFRIYRMHQKSFIKRVFDTYSNRGGSLGTKIETSASCGSQLPPCPYFPSIASKSDGIVVVYYTAFELDEMFRPFDYIKNLKMTAQN